MIDACLFNHDSGLFQQACDITNGIYLKIPHMKGLLQYLLVGIFQLYNIVLMLLRRQILNVIYDYSIAFVAHVA